MTFEAEGWRVFDPEEVERDPIPGFGGDGGGRIVVVEISPSLRDDGWGARALLSLARRWGRSGERVVLADLGLDAPALHDFLGEENGEGISDVLLYGASIRHVARSQEGGGFYLAPAGTPVAEPEKVLDHPRWATILEGFREASITLAAYLPEATPGAALFRSHATHRILLSGEEEWLDRLAAGADPGEFLAILGPPAPEGSVLEESPASEPPEPSPEPPEGGAAASALDEAPPPTRAPAIPDLSDFPPETPAGRRAQGKERMAGSRTTPLLLLLLLVVVAVVLAAAWLGFIAIPGVELFGHLLPDPFGGPVPG